MSFSDFDRHMMEIALTMARRGLGATAPNPSVGAVLADEASGEVIARGRTQPGGRPHAETEALGRAGARAKGATLYVTLEPCAHHGKTPPCADAIVAAEVRRVVVGVGDPDPRTKGQGLARLRAAGIDVSLGLLSAEARWVTLGHILRVSEQRPFVQLKMAVAADGSVPRGADGRAVFVTGPEARRAAHLLRAESDAILIGSGTARDDDPELTCRLPGLAARSPIRVVMSRGLDLPDNLKVIATAREVQTWVFAAQDADDGRGAELEAAGVRLLRVAPGSGPGLALRPVLRRLADEGVTRLLVEGGPSVWQAFAENGLADEVVLFQAGGPKPAAAPLVVAGRLAPGLDLEHAETRRMGADTLTRFRVARST